MLSTQIIRIVGIVIATILSANVASAWHRRRGEKVQLHFLATSTLLRNTWGQNEDTYLAQLLFPKQNETILVRLVDSYPNEWPPISHEMLASEKGSLRVRPDSGCDLPFGRIMLRTPPGDPLAICPERLSYVPSASCASKAFERSLSICEPVEETSHHADRAKYVESENNDTEERGSKASRLHLSVISRSADVCAKQLGRCNRRTTQCC